MVKGVSMFLESQAQEFGSNDLSTETYDPLSVVKQEKRTGDQIESSTQRRTGIERISGAWPDHESTDLKSYQYAISVSEWNKSIAEAIKAVWAWSQRHQISVETEIYKWCSAFVFLKANLLIGLEQIAKNDCYWLGSRLQDQSNAKEQ